METVEFTIPHFGNFGSISTKVSGLDAVEDDVVGLSVMGNDFGDYSVHIGYIYSKGRNNTGF